MLQQSTSPVHVGVGGSLTRAAIPASLRNELAIQQRLLLNVQHRERAARTFACATTDEQNDNQVTYIQ